MEISDYVSETLIQMVVLTTKFALFYLALIWLALAFWTFRDIRRRSDVWVVQTFAVALTLFFFVPGYWLYLILRPARTLGEVAEERFRDRVLAGYASTCPACREWVMDDFIICPSCRFSLREACSACSHALQPQWKSCPYCGLGLARTSRAPVPISERQVTDGPIPVIA